MKKPFRALLGVTLLEIMLVLAIAAMVIVMSIRYYQSASNNQKVANALNIITAIVAAGESVLTAQGSLTNASSQIAAYLPNSTLPDSPWGGAISISGAGTSSYTINFPVGSTSCASLKALATQNAKMTSSTACPAASLAIAVTE